MRIDLHCHTKATKTGDSPKRNIESDKFKEKVNGVGVEIIGITNHNEFDYEQYLKFIEEVDNDFMIWPGVELDVKGIKNEDGHVLIVSNPDNASNFNEVVKEFIGDKSCDDFYCTLDSLIGLISKLDCIVMPHFFKPKSLCEESIAYLKENIQEPYRLLYEPSNYRSLGILINHKYGSIIGSDVKDWDKYHECDFANIKVDVDSYNQFLLLIKKDENLIDTLLHKQYKDTIDISYGSDSSENVEFYDDINIIFGTKGTGKSEVLKSIKTHFNSKGKDIGYYEPKNTEDKIDEKLDVKLEERKLSFYGKENLSQIFTDLKAWSDKNVTQFKDYLEYVKGINKNANKERMKIVNISTIVDEFDPKFEKDNKCLTNFNDIIESFGKIDLTSYIDSDDIENLNTLLSKLGHSITESMNSNWINSKSVVYSNFTVDTLKDIVEKKTELKTKPSDTGFLTFAKNRLKIINELRKVKLAFDYTFEDTEVSVGKLEKGKELKLKTSARMLCSQSKTDEFNTGINNLKDAKNCIMTAYDKSLTNDFNNSYSNLKEKLNEFGITSMDSFLGVIKRFEINGEKYKPSSGEATMIVLDEILKTEHDVYLLDEPEKSLGNTYVNDVLVTKINELSKHKKTVIIVTHNANIAVRTFPFRSILKEYSNGEYKTYVGNPFTNKLINIKDNTDTKEWKDESIKILEGGKEAFEERGEIYG